MKMKLIAAALVAAILGTGTAMAGQATGTMQVSMQVTSSCNVTTQPLTFSPVSGIGTVANQSATDASGISVVCSKGVPYTVALVTSQGTAGAGKMVGATSGNANTIAYQLYQDVGHTLPWGSIATAGSVTGNEVSGSPGNGVAPQVFPVYATVQGSALDVAPDTYSDTVTVDVNY